MHRTLLIIYVIWIQIALVAGQGIHYSFTQLSTNQGLSQATVKSALMDRKGRLWIGTQNGLNCYSQQMLKTFIHQNEAPHSLPDNYRCRGSFPWIAHLTTT